MEPSDFGMSFDKLIVLSTIEGLMSSRGQLIIRFYHQARSKYIGVPMYLKSKYYENLNWIIK
jgi:hypothetical protein